MTDEFSPLTIEEYAVQALTTDQRSDSGSLTFPLLGLFGETGSLLSEVKKKQRNRASYVGYAGAVVEELGDVLWYLTAVAARGGLTLSDITANLGRGYSDWQSAGDTALSFASLQPEIMPRPTDPSSAFEKTLLQLAGEVGF
jgi:NTP pyrophosphatase (non-canonical NTP hydrolase)